ncbi:4'-phosphopantetheinyl transferase [Aequitasia blattaphilus]|uniref:4'-phosphopantetheinyl transferase superfamily protein n=1 Tax=Aequitasia blattaphilus TaxID=2949332 RepID=A0ABT1ECZ4_9FIRM|nr:4'-phosphopantetheinyl transferase superfamily protein [Aequitasia blattaphilus]MCP1102726.1 4'-phosphopantetheinyl transferase superfamily protein [Aequitasia blattaphilus]MCR8615366.1 4'-phosphopantetheinyl transferase superfamily protein [Aequitasia blattaphilus]
MVRTYYLKWNSDILYSDVEKYEILLSKQRREKVHKYLQESDKITSILGGLLIQRGLDKERVEFYFNSHGKPKARQSNLEFNLSHSGNHLLCSVSNEGAIGVDIERKREAPLPLMKRYFHPEEIEYVDGKKKFFEIWTKKEAYVKMTGEGLTKELSGINTFRIPAFFQTEETKETIYTLCMRKEPKEMVFVEVKLEDLI